ncbi:MAG: hypothetical protein ACREUW_12335 [Burkholderiales bacterium]
MNAAAPGRACPADYGTPPGALAGAPAFTADTLYVVGGLYGNAPALEALLARAAREPVPPRIVFNGDFHWFDADPDTFARVQASVLRHTALRGNVETELAHEDRGAGCGCGYPAWVGDAEVERSNRIMTTLAATARRHPAARGTLAALPATLVATVGGLRVGIVHGDTASLAGWRYAQENLATPAARAALAADFEANDLRVTASSHTCLPVATLISARAGRCALINNGAAGMPNFAGTTHGVFTRIAHTPAPDALYRATLDGVAVEALPLHYDAPTFLRGFDRQWPAGSPAALSYRERIVRGPAYAIAQATRDGFEPVPQAPRTRRSTAAETP